MKIIEEKINRSQLKEMAAGFGNLVKAVVERRAVNYQHQELAKGRWFELSLVEQLANVGSEVEQTISWRNKGNAEYGRLAFAYAARSGR